SSLPPMTSSSDSPCAPSIMSSRIGFSAGAAAGAGRRAADDLRPPVLRVATRVVFFAPPLAAALRAVVLVLRAVVLVLRAVVFVFRAVLLRAAPPRAAAARLVLRAAADLRPPAAPR